jgi:hypothetical protein
MPDTPSLTLIKEFTYRGSAEEWSNTYHFSGTVPSSDALWKALADAWIAEEKKVVNTSTTYVRAYGYEAGNESSVWQHDYTTPPQTPVTGTYSMSASASTPGDAAAMIRWYTGQLTSPGGKKIYCRKYFHGVAYNSPDPDQVDAGWVTRGNTYGAFVIGGTLPGSVKYCGPQGAVLSLPVVSSYLTTRTLKRRGKRPPTS